MIPIITVSPEPPNGIFCAEVQYTFTVECPNARQIKWFVESAPTGFNASDVTFTADQSFSTKVTFPFPGQWQINVECKEPA